MRSPLLKKIVTVGGLLGWAVLRSAEPAAPAGTVVPPALKAWPKQDAQGNPIRYAVTGHVSNYDEAKVGGYVLPDPLLRLNGQRVRDAATWFNERRPEILRLYEQEIFGRVPALVPGPGPGLALALALVAAQKTRSHPDSALFRW